MKKYLIIFFISFASCSDENQDYSLKKYFERISGIELPKRMITVEEFDNGEFAAEAIYKVENKELKKFVANNSFSSLDSMALCDSALYISRLKKQNRIYNIKGFLLLNGYIKSNSWRILIDTSSNKLWLYDEYPDQGGTPPSR